MTASPLLRSTQFALVLELAAGAAQASSGVDPTPTTPEEFGAYLKSEYEKWGKVVCDSGATVS